MGFSPKFNRLWPLLGATAWFLSVSLQARPLLNRHPYSTSIVFVLLDRYVYNHFPLLTTEDFQICCEKWPNLKSSAFLVPGHSTPSTPELSLKKEVFYTSAPLFRARCHHRVDQIAFVDNNFKTIAKPPSVSI